MGVVFIAEWLLQRVFLNFQMLDLEIDVIIQKHEQWTIQITIHIVTDRKIKKK